eukprot:6179151-Pleurochrysis_carterae.AAC.2
MPAAHGGCCRCIKVQRFASEMFSFPRSLRHKHAFDAVAAELWTQVSATDKHCGGDQHAKPSHRHLPFCGVVDERYRPWGLRIVLPSVNIERTCGCHKRAHVSFG